jgi:hypothetical protein
LPVCYPRGAGRPRSEVRFDAVIVPIVSLGINRVVTTLLDLIL